jgi:hypothetical protein
MALHVFADVSYLCRSHTRSVAGAIFFLGNHNDPTRINGSIHVFSSIIPCVQAKLSMQPYSLPDNTQHRFEPHYRTWDTLRAPSLSCAIPHLLSTSLRTALSRNDQRQSICASIGLGTASDHHNLLLRIFLHPKTLFNPRNEHTHNDL